MAKPFSDLEKRAIAILSNGGNPATSQDQELAKYWQWKLNPSLPSHDLPAASTRTVGRKLDDVAINPFGVDMAAGTFAKVTVSQRSAVFANPGTKTALQHTVITPTTTAYRLGRFTPARVYIRTGAAAASTERTSRITGRKYKTYYTGSDEGYSLPFGQNTEGDTVQERQTAITAAVKVQDPLINLITFTPEKVRS